jgi:predicted nuclease of predicted toxin-antitoxin system
VTAIAHDYLHALKDSEVLAIAVKEQRIVITNDRDFGELIVRRHLPHAGVILFRLADEHLQAKQNWFLHVFTQYSSDLHNLIVITDQKIRVRRTK